MNKNVLSFIIVIMLSGWSGLKAQTQLYFQDFNTGAASEWSLDASIGNLSSTGNADNYWLINNVYAGNSTWGVAATANEPSGITGYPNSYYMHVTNGANNGIFSDYNANFEAPETGNEVAAMNTPIVATGYTGVTLTFWYVCDGGNTHYYGTLYYSTNGGTTWTQEGSTYGSVTTWTQATVTDANWSNAASLEFAFVWVQTGGGSGTATDPPWGVDDIKVVGTAAVTGPPVPGFDVNDSSGCQGNCFTFTDTSTGGVTSRLWTFTGGTPPTSTAASPTVCYATAGTYAVKLVVTNSSGSDSVTKSSAITIHAKPNAGPDQSFCASSTSTTMAATGTGTWTQSGSNPAVTTIANASSPTTSVSGFTLAGVYAFYWSLNGCSDTIDITVTAKPNAGPDQSTCQFSAATMDAAGSGTWTAAGSNPAVVSFSSTTSPTATVSGLSAAGTYVLYWSLGGCTDTANIDVTAKPNAGPDQSFCASSTSTTMAATGTGTWTQSGSNPAVTTIANSTSPTTSVSGFTVAGTYSFYWSKNGCSDTVEITVSAKPNAGPDQSTCQFTTATMDAAGTGTWTAAGSNPAVVSFSSTTSPTATVSGLNAAGTYVLYWSLGGCSDTANIDVTAKPNAGSDQTICQYNTTSMAATGSGTWTASGSNPTLITIANIASPTTGLSGFSVVGTYTFYWSNNGCTDTVDITVTNKPNAGTDQTICQYDDATLAANGTGTWTASPSNASVVSFSNPASPTSIVSGFNAAGVYQLYWSLGSCSDTVNINVTAKPNAGSDQGICQFGSVTMSGTGSGTWTANGSNPAFTTITSITSATTTVTGFTQTGAYTFYWSYAGCQDTVVITVSAAPTASITQSGDTLIASPSGASYQWIHSGTVVATTQEFLPTVAGPYEVVVTENGCSDTSASYSYKPLGIATISGSNVTIWPNPFNDHIEINLGDMNSAGIEIYSILGTKVVSGTYSNHASIDMTPFSTGVYMIHIKNDRIDTTRMITKQ